ncbi:MAG: DUF1326 domain-containing protein [Candidatus Eisenbacteria bacterium]|uniref:DUF1326 domain-containing protein n=1 Tax=Eiseniibacteriota bacterium TaxID=2212470 RepID=A0A538SWN4_UNCEI|nr:MAG: DUF1326 domain-containing protein [Candidatus Eisenbacteria bacterium]TMQ63356.1 MAG: DUF1326 domain-containing protein [Candidatus Eisenbacteria bacterium]
MKVRLSLLGLGLLFVFAGSLMAADAKAPAKPWTMNATIIEACSCPMFCQCYFSTEPASHEGHMAGQEGHKETYCRFNNAYKVNRGTYNGVSLAGAKFWISGDLGASFANGETDWAVLTFDPSVTPAQREGIQAIVGKVYPVKWASFAVGADAPVMWEHKLGSDVAHATLDGGKAGEVMLKSSVNKNAAGPVVIKNLKYFGAPRNDGFVLMPNEIETYRLGDKAFEFKGTNGFMITFDIASKDIKEQATN